MINLYDYERRWNMMPLTFMNIGETKTITKVGGKNETRQFLEKLGFVVGGEVTVVSEINVGACLSDQDEVGSDT